MDTTASSTHRLAPQETAALPPPSHPSPKPPTQTPTPARDAILLSSKMKKEVDRTHSNDSGPHPPFLILFDLRIFRRTHPRTINAALIKLWETTTCTFPFDVFPQPVAFLDNADRTACMEATHDIRALDFATIRQLLEAARCNAAAHRGLLFAFGEMPRWTGVEALDLLRRGHYWAGMLVRKADGNGWCFNIHCTTPLPSRKADPRFCLGYYAGRRKLWAALAGARMEVTEVNLATIRVSTARDSCVMETMFWLYMASRMEGGLWRPEDDDRMGELALRPVASGSGLYELHS